MAGDREEAGATLADIAGVERRTKEFLTYAKVSESFTLWGTVWFLGYGLTHFVPKHAGTIWLILNSLGIAGSFALAALARRRSGSPFRPQIPAILLTFIVFGFLWTYLGRMGWREQAAFWPTFFSFALIVFGAWAGRALVLAGAVLTLLTMAGYIWSGAYYDLWMAVVGGGALVGLGVWLRR